MLTHPVARRSNAYRMRTMTGEKSPSWWVLAWAWLVAFVARFFAREERPAPIIPLPRPALEPEPNPNAGIPDEPEEPEKPPPLAARLFGSRLRPGLVELPPTPPEPEFVEREDGRVSLWSPAGRQTWTSRKTISSFRGWLVRPPYFGEMNVKMIGTIKMFNEQKGFGFLNHEDHGDLFFHVSSLLDGRKIVAPGDRVEFMVGEGPRGPRAVGVRVLS